MELFKRSGRIYLQTVLAYFMCFILYLSFTTIFLGLGTGVIGYQTYTVAENGEKIVTGEHFFADGEKEEYPTDERYVELRSKQPDFVYWIEQLLVQGLAVFLFVFFIETTISKMAAVDRTEYQYQNGKKRSWYGFVIGSVAAIPSFLWYCILILCRWINVEILQLEYIFNYVFFTYLRIVTGSFGQARGIVNVQPPSLASLSFLQYLAMFLPVAALPIICGLCYLFKFKKINIGETIMYRSNKG